MDNKTLSDVYDIMEYLHNKSFLDDENLGMSEYKLFVKDMYYENQEPSINELALIIVDTRNGYVVNNNYRFDYLEIKDNTYTFKTKVELKDSMIETSYYLKK